MTTIIKDHEDLKAHVGQHLGYSDYMTVSQEQVQTFADATGDHQWIHLDVERAKKESPFGGTIAHGFLTLSLLPMLLEGAIRMSDVTMGVNYGLNRVRFPAPMPVGEKLRMRAKLLSVEDIPGGAQITTELSFEREGGEKPVCVAESLSRVYVG